MVKFTALQSAKVAEPKAPKPQDEALGDALERKLLMAVKENPQIAQKDIVKTIGSSRATVQRLMKSLTEQRKIERVGGKRYGHWEIHE